MRSVKTKSLIEFLQDLGLLFVLKLFYLQKSNHLLLEIENYCSFVRLLGLDVRTYINYRKIDLIS